MSGPPPPYPGNAGMVPPPEAGMYPPQEKSPYPPGQPQPCAPPPAGYPQQAYPPPPPGTIHPPGYGPPPPGYGPPPPVQPPTLIVQPVMGPGVFSDNPVQTRCPKCNADIMTSTYYETGTLSWILCLILCFFGFIFGCCLIPFCIDSTKDVIHSCPNCNQQIGRYNRM